MNLVKEITDAIAASQAYPADMTIFNVPKSAVTSRLGIGKIVNKKLSGRCWIGAAAHRRFSPGSAASPASYASSAGSSIRICSGESDSAFCSWSCSRSFSCARPPSEEIRRRLWICLYWYMLCYLYFLCIMCTLSNFQALGNLKSASSNPHARANFVRQHCRMNVSKLDTSKSKRPALAVFEIRQR